MIYGWWTRLGKYRNISSFIPPIHHLLSRPTLYSCKQSSSCVRAQLLLLVPKPQHGSISSSLAKIISASKGAAISIESLKIKLSGRGSVRLVTIHPELLNGEDELDQLARNCRFLVCTSTPPALVLASPIDAGNVSLFAAPSYSSPSALHIPAKEFMRLMQSDCPITAFSYDQRVAYFLDKTTEEATFFRLPPRGACFVLSPAYTISTPSNDTTFHLSIPAPHIPVSSLHASSTDLPTPPPSPLLGARSPRRRTPKQVRFASQAVVRRDRQLMVDHPLVAILPRFAVFFALVLKAILMLTLRLLLGNSTPHRSVAPRQEARQPPQTILTSRLGPQISGPPSVEIDVPTGQLFILARCKTQGSIEEAFKRLKMQLGDMEVTTMSTAVSTVPNSSDVVRLVGFDSNQAGRLKIFLSEG